MTLHTRPDFTRKSRFSNLTGIILRCKYSSCSLLFLRCYMSLCNRTLALAPFNSNDMLNQVYSFRFVRATTPVAGVLKDSVQLQRKRRSSQFKTVSLSPSLCHFLYSTLSLSLPPTAALLSIKAALLPHLLLFLLPSTFHKSIPSAYKPAFQLALCCLSLNQFEYWYRLFPSILEPT
jgi:hypothetical protein